MAWWGNDQPVTYADIRNAQDADGNISTVIEMMEELSPLVEDMIVMEGNMENGHKGTIRTGLPKPTWRKLNQGVKPTKGTRGQVVDTCGNMEAYAESDKDLADMSGDPAMFRLTEAAAHVEGMTQEMEDTAFYGDGATPEAFIGLSPRFNDLGAQNGSQIVDAGGTGSDNTSIWLMTWDPRIAFGIYPKHMGQSGGVTRTDHGEVTAYDDTGGRFQAYREHFKWQLGVHVIDWRYIVRIANIDVSILLAGTTKLVPLLIDAQHKLFKQGIGRSVLYCNRGVATALDHEAESKDNVWLTHREYAGEYIQHFRKFPIRETDALLNTEARVV